MLAYNMAEYNMVEYHMVEYHRVDRSPYQPMIGTGQLTGKSKTPLML